MMDSELRKGSLSLIWTKAIEHAGSGLAIGALVGAFFSTFVLGAIALKHELAISRTKVVEGIEATAGSGILGLVIGAGSGVAEGAKRRYEILEATLTGSPPAAAPPPV